MIFPPVIVVPTTQTTSVFDPLVLLTQLQQAAIIRPQNPPPGIGGWVMDIVTDEEVNLTSNITDHYTEANVAIQDNIALPPVEVQTRGLVAELLLTPGAAGAVDDPFPPDGDPLPEIPSQGPELTPQAAQVIALMTAGSAMALIGVLRAGSLAQYEQALSPQQPGQTRQSNAFAYFVQLWQGRQLFTVETPWGFFANMALKSLSGKQGKDSRYQTEFSLTFKQIRFANNVSVNLGSIFGRANPYIQASNPTVNQVGNGVLTDAQVAAISAQMRNIASNPTP